MLLGAGVHDLVSNVAGRTPKRKAYLDNFASRSRPPSPQATSLWLRSTPRSASQLVPCYKQVPW
eukprot:2934733-Alexandrium_andersonii.AAC.1